MVKVVLELVLNDSWDGYVRDNVNNGLLLEDILSTLGSDQKDIQEEVVSATIKSKQIIHT